MGAGVPVGMTLAEKLVARAAGRDAVVPGEIVTCRVDLAMMHDSSGPRRIAPMLEEIGAGVWDAARVVIITDHFVGERDAAADAIQELTRAWAQANGVGKLHEAEGICHVVLPERGHLRPGMFVVGGDSHSPTGGAFGCFVIGIGATEMAGVLATGEIWVRVPATVAVRIRGRLGDGVTAKDVMLMLCRRLGINGAGYKVLEYGGEAVAAMSMGERMVLTNMSAELGAKTGLVAPDEHTLGALRRYGVDDADAAPWRSDADARFEAVVDVDAGALEPQVAAPHSPENSDPVSHHAGTPVSQAYVGACTGAKLEDLQMAARVLRGRRVAASVALLVAPASRRATAAAQADGTLGALRDAGARILPSACGACIGRGPGALGPGRVGISSSSRNFRGRMGDPTSSTYLASPYTVAAAAVAGHITDPRELIGQ